METYWITIALCGCVFQTVFTCFEYAKKFLPAVIFKGIASLFFILLGIACLSVTKDARFGGLVIAGLICGAAGDVLLNLPPLMANAKDKVFMAGMAAFLTGHLLYVAALLTRGANALLIAVPLCAVLSAAILLPVLRRIDVPGKIRTFGIVYVIAVLFMTSCAAGLFILTPANTGYLLFTFGAVLFTLSDVILIFHMFGRKKHKTHRALNLATYYLGQVLIAASLLFI